MSRHRCHLSPLSTPALERIHPTRECTLRDQPSRCRRFQYQTRTTALCTTSDRFNRTPLARTPSDRGRPPNTRRGLDRNTDRARAWKEHCRTTTDDGARTCHRSNCRRRATTNGRDDVRKHRRLTSSDHPCSLCNTCLA